PFAHVILRSEATKNLGLRINSATKNLNDIRFFAIAQNDKRVFFRLFASSSNMRPRIICKGF
ncbi:MAG: hypothetical protein B1H13_07200, partial [Desulfobacteraceae bacterium 4484_190.3]